MKLMALGLNVSSEDIDWWSKDVSMHATGNSW